MFFCEFGGQTQQCPRTSKGAHGAKLNVRTAWISLSLQGQRVHLHAERQSHWATIKCKDKLWQRTGIEHFPSLEAHSGPSGDRERCCWSEFWFGLTSSTGSTRSVSRHLRPTRSNCFSRKKDQRKQSAPDLREFLTDLREFLAGLLCGRNTYNRTRRSCSAHVNPSLCPRDQ